MIKWRGMIPGISIQPRDIEILVSMFESRILTVQHLASFHFDGKIDATRKRIQKLKAAGLIVSRRRNAYEPEIHSISKSSFELLTAEGALAEYPAFSWPATTRRCTVSEQTLVHELMTLDIKAAFTDAVRNSKAVSIAKFTTWPLLCQFSCSEKLSFGTRESIVKPDGFIQFLEKANDGEYSHDFYLETDRSSESLDVISRKCLSYRDYYRSGGFAVRNGGTSSAYQEFPFRVLIVCRSKARTFNIAQKLISLHPPILKQVWLATLDNVIRDPFGPVWLEPCAFRNATSARCEPCLVELMRGAGETEIAA